MAPEAVLAACRFGQDAAALLLWGAAAYLWLLVPPRLASHLARRLRRGQGTATAALAVLTVLRLPAEAATIGTGWADAVSPSFLRAVVFGTSAGHAWALQVISAAALLIALRLPSRLGLSTTALASGIFLAALCLTGHSAMDEGWRGALARANMLCHVLSAAGWLGSLPPVLLLFRMDMHRDPEVGVALRRFSLVGHGVVAVAILTGTGSTALVLGRWPLDLGCAYVALLDAKVGLVALMAGVALLNRYVVVPRCAGSPAAARWLIVGTIVEVVLGVGATALVAVFGLLDPGC